MHWLVALGSLLELLSATLYGQTPCNYYFSRRGKYINIGSASTIKQCGVSLFPIVAIGAEIGLLKQSFVKKFVGLNRPQRMCLAFNMKPDLEPAEFDELVATLEDLVQQVDNLVGFMLQRNLITGKSVILYLIGSSLSQGSMRKMAWKLAQFIESKGAGEIDGLPDIAFKRSGSAKEIATWSTQLKPAKDNSVHLLALHPSTSYMTKSLNCFLHTHFTTNDIVAERINYDESKAHMNVCITTQFVEGRNWLIHLLHMLTRTENLMGFKLSANLDLVCRILVQQRKFDELVLRMTLSIPIEDVDSEMLELISADLNLSLWSLMALGAASWTTNSQEFSLPACLYFVTCFGGEPGVSTFILEDSKFSLKAQHAERHLNNWLSGPLQSFSMSLVWEGQNLPDLALAIQVVFNKKHLIRLVAYLLDTIIGNSSVKWNRTIQTYHFQHCNPSEEGDYRMVMYARLSTNKVLPAELEEMRRFFQLVWKSVGEKAEPKVVLLKPISHCWKSDFAKVYIETPLEQPDLAFPFVKSIVISNSLAKGSNQSYFPDDLDILFSSSISSLDLMSVDFRLQ